MTKDDKHRLTIRIPHSMKESLQSMSNSTGLPMTELVVSGTMLLLAHEEAMRVYENRLDSFIDSAALRLDFLIEEHKEKIEDLAARLADMLEADRSIIEYFKAVLDEHVKQLKGTSGFRSTSGSSSPRVGPTGAPILG